MILMNACSAHCQNKPVFLLTCTLGCVSSYLSARLFVSFALLLLSCLSALGLLLKMSNKWFSYIFQYEKKNHYWTKVKYQFVSGYTQSCMCLLKNNLNNCISLVKKVPLKLQLFRIFIPFPHSSRWNQLNWRCL